MAIATCVQTAGPQWDVNHCAVWMEKIQPKVADGGVLAMLRHPTYPFYGVWDRSVTNDHLRVANDYLDAVNARLGLPQAWIDSLKCDPPDGFDVLPKWLDIKWGLDVLQADRDPRQSFWVGRCRDPETAASEVEPLDRTLILLAGEQTRFKAEDGVTPTLGSQRGVRLVAHVAELAHDKWLMRITGVSASYPVKVVKRMVANGVQVDIPPLLQINTALLALVGILDNVVVILTRFQVITDRLVEVYANVLPKKSSPPPDNVPPKYSLAYAVRATFAIDPAAPNGLAPVSVLKCPLVAHAQRTPAVDDHVDVDLFIEDPASSDWKQFALSRPGRISGTLDEFRKPQALRFLTREHGRLVYKHAKDYFAVTRSWFVDRNVNETTENNPEDVSTQFAVRSNAFAAASAYQRAQDLFERMIDFGLRPLDYFKLASLPLILRYRSGVRPGPGKDGNTVNAEVAFYPRTRYLGTEYTAGTDPLEVRFALADLKRGATRINPPGTQRVNPLGIAADRRWAWHEFGHVLLAAATGELELPFVHSVGDALAAIVSDPVLERSQRGAAFRGMTFPWAHITRRHDREPTLGWSWCGRFHRQAEFLSGPRCNRKGYLSEQLMSSSLFRLYLALGGETLKAGVPDEVEREAASSFVTYLIMRAVTLLGPLPIVPAATPDQFVSALIDADVGTEAPGTHPVRFGGTAHKVIRWAFEAQGLYGDDGNLDMSRDDIGKPPAVDIYIADQRDPSGPGGTYRPVSLDWGKAGSPPKWHARESSIEIDVAAKQIWIYVHNRGSLTAEKVSVRVWATKKNAGSSAPPWTDKAWEKPLHGPSTRKQVKPGSTATRFGPFKWQAPLFGASLILAEATCPADRANTDLAASDVPTGLPCARSRTPIRDLVAGDNNLGLLVYRRPVRRRR